MSSNSKDLTAPTDSNDAPIPLNNDNIISCKKGTQLMSVHSIYDYEKKMKIYVGRGGGIDCHGKTNLSIRGSFKCRLENIEQYSIFFCWTKSERIYIYEKGNQPINESPRI